MSQPSIAHGSLLENSERSDEIDGCVQNGMIPFSHVCIFVVHKQIKSPKRRTHNRLGT